ncbi:MAG: hypothetical protein IJP28_05815 [Erysipelotrichales bacterium]|nr:hypothetical protein [Erysipelotrichales bacterium]
MLEEKRYTVDGYLLVSELSKCDLFEMDPNASLCDNVDCFFCKFSDFRKREYIEDVNREARGGVMFSICHHEKNRITK